ncbi:hypothetical protein SAMN05443429_11146 [Cruoricaptor ignavus]|uniref:Uncharacterized protein n=1 Tax=Cruoricaptor ignavus TaxID=1118202 RepID=A0A1M6H6L5_9FLAO|nr:DUF6804 family protein [Cruoricaptor ignavus]SHJ17822.1 hypothetical protein SAMN05443429_11146 [Cruoricaptor ignavus]
MPNNLLKTLSVILAAMLFLCLAPLPYGYYQLLRVFAMVVFIMLAFYRSQEKDIHFWIFIFLTLLFQPFFKIALGRSLWNIVDVLVGIYLLWLNLGRKNS